MGCKCTLLGHIQLFTHEIPQVLYKALNEFISQSALVFVQVQPSRFYLLNCMRFSWVHISVLSLWMASHPSVATALLSLVSSAEAAVDLTVPLVKIRVHQSQDRALRESTCHQPPPEHKAINHNFLAVSIQPIPYPPDIPPFEFMSLQSRMLYGTMPQALQKSRCLISDIFPLLTIVFTPSQKADWSGKICPYTKTP